MTETDNNIMHPQVTRMMPVRVDEGIADLLEKIWAMGYYTEWSCQDNPRGYVYVVFRHWEYYRGAQSFLDKIGYESDRLTAYKVTPYNGTSYLRFPNEDIPLVMKLIDEYLGV